MNEPSDGLDLQIRHFAEALSQGYRAFPDFGTLPLNEARRIAEIVRTPWRSGGPVMAKTQEMWIPGPHGPVRIRIHYPETEKDCPALIYLHGGGWTIFSLDTHDRVMREYAARSGCCVVGVDYPLSPEAKFPVALEQITAVALWLSEYGANVGILPDHLAIGGDSVGGNLSLTTALTLRDCGHGDVLSGLLLLYGVYSRDISTESARRFGDPPYTLNAEEMETFWQNYLTDPRQAENPQVQPLCADLRGLPPVHMCFGTCDILAEQNHAMAEKLQQAGVATEVHPVAGATHSFLEAVSVSDLASDALDTGAAWLRSRLF